MFFNLTNVNRVNFLWARSFSPDRGLGVLSRMTRLEANAALSFCKTLPGRQEFYVVRRGLCSTREFTVGLPGTPPTVVELSECLFLMSSGRYREEIICNN